MTEPVTLHGRASTLGLEVRGDVPPAWRWWGPRVNIDAVPPLDTGRPPASFSPDEDRPLTIVPTFGDGWSGPSALRAHRERDGRDDPAKLAAALARAAATRPSHADTVARPCGARVAA